MSFVQIRRPAEWQSFQKLCAALYGREINDSNMQLYARQGNIQNGVDIIGRRNGKEKLIGIQCKLMEELPGKRLTVAEVKKEIKKAKKFKPPIDEFIIATTDVTRKDVQDLINKTNEEHKEKGLF